jgi:hypothetical protein
VRDIGDDEFFGECAFFSMQFRTLTARSKKFTEVIKLERDEFLEKAELFANVKD